MNTNLTLFELLDLRFEYEQLIQTLQFKSKNGDIFSLRNFIDTGYKNNRFKPGYDRALELAKVIVEQYDKKIDIPSLCGEEV